MPSYEYKCSECEHKFDDLLKIDDRFIPETLPCPNCNKEKTIHIQMGTPPVVDCYNIFRERKIPTPFKERLQKIKKEHPRGKINI